MPSIEVNWWAVLVAVVVSLAVGALWYSPVLFGKAWAKLLGKKPGEMGDVATGYTVTALGALIQVWILVHFVRYAGAITAIKGAEVGFWLWLAFAAVIMASQMVFEARPWKLWGINAGYYFVILAVNGAFLAAWR